VSPFQDPESDQDVGSAKPPVQQKPPPLLSKQCRFPCEVSLRRLCLAYRRRFEKDGGAYPELDSNNQAPARWPVRLGIWQRNELTSLTISPPRECAMKIMGRSRYMNLSCEFPDDRMLLTASFFLTRDNSCTKLIECWNRVFKDVWPLSLTIFASYPTVRTRRWDNDSSFDSSSRGQHTLSFVHVFVRWPCKPWTKTILQSEVNEVYRYAGYPIRNSLGCDGR